MSQNINLYDASLRPRRDVLGFEAVLLVAAAAVLCVGLAAGVARWSLARIEPLAASTAAELKAQQAAAKAQAARLVAARPDTSLQAEIAAAERTLQQRRAALRKLGGSESSAGEGGFAGHLEALARQSLDGLWLTGMTLRPGEIVLKGQALRPALIPAYVQRLDREAALQGRGFKALEIDRPLETALAASGAGRATAIAQVGSTGPSEGPAPAARAEFVEFTLVGASAGSDAEGAPAGARR